MRDWISAAIEQMAPMPVRAFPPRSSPHYHVYTWLGTATLTFASGRTEMRCHAGTIVVTPNAPHALVVAKLQNAADSMADFRRLAERGGWPRHNRKGRRRFVALQWSAPE